MELPILTIIIYNFIYKIHRITWRYIEKAHEATPLEIVRSTAVPRPTVNQALTKLLRLKRIERFGVGRGKRYRKI